MPEANLRRTRTPRLPCPDRGEGTLLPGSIVLSRGFTVWFHPWRNRRWQRTASKRLGRSGAEDLRITRNSPPSEHRTFPRELASCRSSENFPPARGPLPDSSPEVLRLLPKKSRDLLFFPRRPGTLSEPHIFLRTQATRRVTLRQHSIDDLGEGR